MKLHKLVLFLVIVAALLSVVVSIPFFLKDNNNPVSQNEAFVNPVASTGNEFVFLNPPYVFRTGGKIDKNYKLTLANYSFWQPFGYEVVPYRTYDQEPISAGNYQPYTLEIWRGNTVLTTSNFFTERCVKTDSDYCDRQAYDYGDFSVHSSEITQVPTKYVIRQGTNELLKIVDNNPDNTNPLLSIKSQRIENSYIVVEWQYEGKSSYKVLNAEISNDDFKKVREVDLMNLTEDKTNAVQYNTFVLRIPCDSKYGDLCGIVRGKVRIRLRATDGFRIYVWYSDIFNLDTMKVEPYTSDTYKK